MPGLRLTPAQAARLLGLDNGSCQRVLSTLVSSAFLRWTADGSVIRVES
jgi:DNA-binding IclR family transcriptional regulator